VIKCKQPAFAFVLSLLLLGIVFFGQKAYVQAHAYEDVVTEMVALQGAEEQAKRQLENLATSIFGTVFEDGREVTIKKLQNEKEGIQEKALLYTRYCMYLLVVILLSYFVVTLQTFTFFSSLAAMIVLVLGLITPILMVTIHKEVEYIGDIVLSFESKGVIESIVKLFEKGDMVVAFVILLFSVIGPVLKVSSLLFIAIFMQSPFAHKIVKFFKIIGKWSMVDVFIVAVFLVYLTGNKGDVSRAEVEVGLYFFLAYVIVSMLMSLSADKMLRDKVN